MANSTFNLTGKAALVTGGNGGIGLGMAEALAESGADICIWGQNEEKNKAAAEKLKSYGRRVVAFKCDVSEWKNLRKTLYRAFPKDAGEFRQILVRSPSTLPVTPVPTIPVMRLSLMAVTVVFKRELCIVFMSMFLNPESCKIQVINYDLEQQKLAGGFSESNKRKNLGVH